MSRGSTFLRAPIRSDSGLRNPSLRDDRAEDRDERQAEGSGLDRRAVVVVRRMEANHRQQEDEQEQHDRPEDRMPATALEGPP
jgi:hypothetical protein